MEERARFGNQLHACLQLDIAAQKLMVAEVALIGLFDGLIHSIFCLDYFQTNGSILATFGRKTANQRFVSEEKSTDMIKVQKTYHMKNDCEKGEGLNRQYLIGGEEA